MLTLRDMRWIDDATEKLAQVIGSPVKEVQKFSLGGRCKREVVLECGRAFEVLWNDDYDCFVAYEDYACNRAKNLA